MPGRKANEGPVMNGREAQDSADFDVIHAHSAWVGTSLLAVRAARRAGKPSVLMPHEALTRFDMARGGNAGLRAAKRVLRNWYLKHVDAIVTSSELESRDSEL